MTAKTVPTCCRYLRLLVSLILLCCRISLVVFILYFRLWGNALWPGTPRGGGNSCWVNTDACELVRLAKFQVILEVDHATYHKSILKSPNIKTSGKFLPGHSSDVHFRSEELRVVLLRSAMSTSCWEHNGKQVQGLVPSARATLLGVGKPISPPIYGSYIFTQPVVDSCGNPCLKELAVQIFYYDANRKVKICSV